MNSSTRPLPGALLSDLIFLRRCERHAPGRFKGQKQSPANVAAGQQKRNGKSSKLFCSKTKNVMPDQAQKTRPIAPGSGGGGEGPTSPKVEKPSTEELLKRMRKVDPDQAKRYRQRTGQ